MASPPPPPPPSPPRLQHPRGQSPPPSESLQLLQRSLVAAPAAAPSASTAILALPTTTTTSQPQAVHTPTANLQQNQQNQQQQQHQQNQQQQQQQKQQQNDSATANPYDPPVTSRRDSTAGSDDRATTDRRRVINKFLRKRRETTNPSRLSTTVPSAAMAAPAAAPMELPDRLRDGDESNDDREDPMAATTVMQMQPGHPISVNMSQSIFGILAAASSRFDCNDRFDAGSSSSDDNDEHDHPPQQDRDGVASPDRDPDLAQSMTPEKTGRRRRRLSDNKLLRSLPTLPRISRARSSKHKRADSGRLSPTSERDEPLSPEPWSQSSSSSSQTQKQQRPPQVYKSQSQPQPPSQSQSDPQPQSQSPSRSQSQSHSPFHRLQRRLSSNHGRAAAAAAAAEADAEEEAAVAEGSDTVPPLPHLSSSSRIAPVMSRMLEARAEMSARPSFDLEERDRDTLGERPGSGEGPDDGDHAMSTLAKRLMEIFEFEQPEQVINEYPCWLLQNVLLQGYMYITARHVCFYAYLPKKAQETAKAGYLYKTGKHMVKYTRYWFSLKGDVLTYSSHAANLYFPSGHIDLRYAIDAKITDTERDGVHFSVMTPNRTYHFRADSAPSAKDWVKTIHRVIFRSHNDGDSVKISLPIENIMDIEVMTMVQFAETCKIRVIDNDETYAIDEYFFSFFNQGQEAIRMLEILVDDTRNRSGDEAVVETHSGSLSHSHSPSEEHLSGGSPPPERARVPVMEPVRATLAPPGSIPISSPRASGEVQRGSFDTFRALGRRSMEMTSQPANPAAATIEQVTPRRSFGGVGGGTIRRRSRSSSQRDRNSSMMKKSDNSKDASVDSCALSVEDPGLSSVLAISSSEEQTASQILRGSDIFRGPTVRSGSDGDQPSGPSPARNGEYVGDAGDADSGDRAIPKQGRQQQQVAASPTGSGPALKNITRLGSVPLQRAGALATYLNQTSRRMSSLIATESMGYVEKVSGMWKGGRKHYDEPAGLRVEEHDESETDDKVATSNRRFREHFALPDSERLQATYFSHIVRVIPLYGKVYVGTSHLCFRSLLPGTRTKLVLPLSDMENVDKEKGFRFGYHGLVLVVRAHEELFFEFSSSSTRDDCAVTLLQSLDRVRHLRESSRLRDVEALAEVAAAAAEAEKLVQTTAEIAAAAAAPTVDSSVEGCLLGSEAEAEDAEQAEHEVALAERDALLAETTRRLKGKGLIPDQAGELSAPAPDGPMILYDDPNGSFMGYRPPRRLHITCLTIGSRGDVQPYIALARGLMADGHTVRIATHVEFRGWIEGYGIEFRPVAGDPGRLMQLCIENGTFSLSFLREASSTFRGWLDELLHTAVAACRGTDLLIESPSTMAGIHIAEALEIPYFRAFTMPWTRTRAYPHAFAIPSNRMGGAYNYMTYIMFDNIFWHAISGQINRWRAGTLGLPPTTLERMRPNQVPFLYNFSPSVVAPPLDYSDWIRVTGYWFLDEGDRFEPAEELVQFIARAREDGKRLVYVGFGSIIVPDPAQMTREVIEAVLKADVRCILSKGWSDRLAAGSGAAAAAAAAAAQDQEGGGGGGDSGPALAPVPASTPPSAEEPPMPAEILVIKSAPHDWLFARIDAAAHHGGSGTTGASLRAGIPTIIRPFFGDQFFFANRVEDTGVGIHLKKWGAMPFARALWKATHEERMIAKARVLGEAIRKEHGVQTAIQSIYRDLEYAKSLIKHKTASRQQAMSAAAKAAEVGVVGTEGGEAAAAAKAGVNPTGRDNPASLVPSGGTDGVYDGLEVGTDMGNGMGGGRGRGMGMKMGAGLSSPEEDEEAWTFIGSDEPDPEIVTTRLSKGLMLGATGGRLAEVRG